jgi:multidrug efflux system outer membrane protein
MRGQMRWTCFGQTLFILLVGCTVGPKYEGPPQMDIPSEWHTPPSDGMVAANPDCILWWEALNDPILNSLMQRAAQQNLDLFIAGTRILEARLERKGKEAELYPHIDGSVTAGHLYWSKDLLNSIVGKCGPHRHHSCRRNVNFFEAGFDADWEIDLFGFNKHEINAAQARVESTEESLCDIWITLSAEIARNYVELRGLQQRRNLILNNIETLQESVHLTQQLLTIGMVNSIDLLQIEGQLTQLYSQKPLLDLGIDKAIHRLSILLGDTPDTLFAELCPPQALPHLPCEKPVGIPSELLRRRPDIRRAERNLAAATESVGSAVAALYPRFSIYGFIGEIGTQLRSLTSNSGVTWFAAPQLLFPIFNSRLLTQDVEMNRLQARQALFEYQKSILAALEEVENALTSYRYEMERNEQLNRARFMDWQAYQLTYQLYQRGIKDYLEVLVTNRVLLAAEDAYLQGQVDLLLHYISLYKALGGGWDVSQCN